MSRFIQELGRRSVGSPHITKRPSPNSGHSTYSSEISGRCCRLHHAILVAISLSSNIGDACLPAPPVRKGGVEVAKSARRATSTPSMKVWSGSEVVPGVYALRQHIVP